MRTTAVCLIYLPGPYHPGGRAEVTQLSHQLEQAAPSSDQSRSQLAIYRLPLSQQESLSTGYACPVDKGTVVCPILTIPSSPLGLCPQNHVWENTCLLITGACRGPTYSVRTSYKEMVPRVL